MFIVAANIFTLLMYIVYTFIAFPMTSDESGTSKLMSLFSILTIFNLLSACLVLCQIVSGARRIEGLSAEYGKAVKQQGYVFFLANCVSGGVYYQFSHGNWFYWKWNFFFSTVF